MEEKSLHEQLLGHKFERFEDWDECSFCIFDEDLVRLYEEHIPHLLLEILKVLKSKDKSV